MFFSCARILASFCHILFILLTTFGQLKQLFILLFVQMWMQVAEQVLVALFLFQLTMAGLMGSKGVLAQTICVVPLLFITVAAWVVSHSLLTQPARVISLRAATDLDRLDQVVHYPHLPLRLIIIVFITIIIMLCSRAISELLNCEQPGVSSASFVTCKLTQCRKDEEKTHQSME